VPVILRGLPLWRRHSWLGGKLLALRLNAMSTADRDARAQDRHGRATLLKTSVRDRGADLAPISGPLALELVSQLTAESWSLAGLELPTYTRVRIPCRFVPRRS